MRLDPQGTVAVGELREDDHFYQGKIGGAFATTFPEQVALKPETMARGQERYGIYCSPCHGQTGEGDGMIAKRAMSLQVDQNVPGSWVAPKDLTTEDLRFTPVGALFDSITNGKNNMPAYGPQITTEDRWAIVMYMRALQRARLAKFDDVPPSLRQGL
jgi:mono/diheme cytochrome c family protein